MARIGALYIGIADAESFKTNLREGLRELGYIEGKNIVFEFRSAAAERLPNRSGIGRDERDAFQKGAVRNF
jgi:putative ABC transport system substrate-binding protein